jgi:hypothetical protein
MIRITLIEIALVATPFLLFFLYRAMVGARRTQTGEAVNETPYQILFFTGSAVALAALVAVVLLGRPDSGAATSRDQIYIPPRTENGQVIPGYFISREEAIARGLIEDRPRRRSEDPEAPDPDLEAGELEPPGARAP